MATMKFVRSSAVASNAKVLRFDSSPRHAICKEYGFDPLSYELRDERNEAGMTVWDVFAAPHDAKPYNVGTLFYNPPIWPGGPSTKF